MTPPATRLPPQTRDYLADPSLSPLWTAVRARLERNRLAATGAVPVALDDDGAQHLAGLLGAGTAIRAGTVRVRLDALDAALRRSAAQAGLVAVLTELTGPLVDRAGVRDAARQQSDARWARLDATLAAAGVADAGWVPPFVEGVRRAGVLTRAGTAAAETALEHVGRVLATLRADGALGADGAYGGEPRWELAALASATTGDAHGLDDGRLAAALTLRAAAAALGVPAPDDARQRRALWGRIGVTVDLVSGTVLAWAVRPPGRDPWSTMLRARADLGLITHLTVHELMIAGDVELAPPGSTVFACENPQVVQAAARGGAEAPLLCLGGNPATAGWLLVRRLLAGGVRVAYHGDFDWPGVDIARRLLVLGVEPWRMTSADYTAAVDGAEAQYRLPLTGTAGTTPWDGPLADAMARTGIAVHEESLLPVLLEDLRRSAEPPARTNPAHEDEVLQVTPSSAPRQ